MNNFFGFFTALFATFMGLFTASRGRERKVNEHNQGAYHEMREKLRPYAQRFLLPVFRRDKNDNIIKDKGYKDFLKYEKIMAERKIELLLKRGCKAFMIGGQEIIALNQANANRKALALGLIV